MKLSTKYLYFMLVACACLSFGVLLFGAYSANNILKAKSSDVRDARLQNLVLEEKQRQLTKALTDIHKYRSLADIAKHIVPQDKDQAQTVREIVKIAEQHGVRLGAITFPSSSLGAANTTKDSQLKPVKGISGVMSLEITVQSDTSEPATFTNFINFLNALEHNRRTSLIKGISLTPDGKNPNKLSFTLTLNEYIKP